MKYHHLIVVSRPATSHCCTVVAVVVEIVICPTIRDDGQTCQQGKAKVHKLVHTVYLFDGSFARFGESKKIQIDLNTEASSPIKRLLVQIQGAEAEYYLF